MLWLRRIVRPEPDRLSVVSGGRSLDIQIRRREAARRMTLRVSNATGDVVLTLPDRTSLSAARLFVEGQTGWIAARMASVPARIALEPGAVLPLRGEPHRVLLWSQVRGPTRATQDADGEAVIAVCGDREAVPGRVRRFLIGEAERDIAAYVRRHAAILGVTPSRITLRDTTSRWGSCSSTGALSFSWRVVLAPTLVLDYLAAHEVAHLRELNHSHRFWKLVHDLCPATEEAESWLKRHGSGLHRYG